MAEKWLHGPGSPSLLVTFAWEEWQPGPSGLLRKGSCGSILPSCSGFGAVCARVYCWEGRGPQPRYVRSKFCSGGSFLPSGGRVLESGVHPHHGCGGHRAGGSQSDRSGTRWDSLSHVVHVLCVRSPGSWGPCADGETEAFTWPLIWGRSPAARGQALVPTEYTARASSCPHPCRESLSAHLW